MGTESVTEVATVTVAGRSLEIARFRGFKAQRIMRLAGRIGRRYPELATKVAEFEQAYVEENKIRLTRTEAEFRFGSEAAEISDEAWEGSGGELALKQMPSSYERLAAVWPDLLEAAEEPIMDLLAVVAMTNEDLREADDADRVDAAIAERRKELLHDADATELIELAIAGYDVARGQFGPLVEKVTPFLEMLGLTMGGPPPTESDTSPTERTESETSSPTSSDSETSPSSSTDSQPPTDGPDEKPSTASPGAPSEPSRSD